MSQFERIAYLDRAMREGGGARTAEVAARFEVDARTVKRDIEYLRDRVGAPIEWDAALRAYRYTKKFDDLRFADEKALIVHALLRGFLSNEHYVPLLSLELLDEVSRRVSRDYRRVADRVRYLTPVSEEVALEHFTIVVQAMALGLELDLEYSDRGGAKSVRAVEAERLVNYSGRWYLLAWDLRKADFRTFHLSRIEAASLSRRKAASRADEASAHSRDQAAEAYLQGGFGIFKGGTLTQAAIRITGRAAPLVARQTWHPSQTIVEGVSASGEPFSELRLPVADWTELLGKVLSFGPNAEALSPPAFRKEWKAAIKAMGELAGRGSTSIP
ncbi:MAG TPA: hypothetical protein DIC34_08355 [Treponema sp.]|nr:MAG: hypothetical protein A2001_05650 [Treponema sp. GWC1_61_84]OHE74131.1 MAG: hypothetical protein A2413_12935 [Treponema sp. RIFOXYC1_FULL_61_9]HCM26537.1 hypothetical protein [Treponema sp.]